MIDWALVKQLESDVGRDEFNTVVMLFLEEADDAVDQLRRSPPQGAELAAKMHFLKGSAYSLGFAAFGDLCTQAEVQTGGGSSGEVDLAALISVYDKSRQTFLDDAPKHCGFVAAA